MLEFSDIALAKFLQTAPELGNLILTFVDATHELPNESDIQVGMIVLRNGEEIMYVPVVSKGEGVHPIDSIFLTSKSKFFPLTKDTIETIINSQKMSLGKAKKLPNTIPTNPSVHELVNPPRTGKFVYASASRLTEFLSSIPNVLKDHVLEKISSDSSVYNKLNDVFGLEMLIKALKTRTYDPATQPKDRSVGVHIITEGEDLPTPVIASILTKGYATDGANPLTRVAISSENANDAKFTMLATLDGGYDYDVIMGDGQVRRAFAPNRKLHQYPTPRRARERMFLLFENGDYAINQTPVISGEGRNDRGVIKSLFQYKPPILLKDVNSGDMFAIFGENLDLIGVFSADSVAITNDGCMIRGMDRLNGGCINLQGVRGYTKAPVNTGVDIFVPMTSLVVVLSDNVGFEMERSVTGASRRRELLDWALLNTSLNLTYDNVEFAVNGRPMGKEASVMKLLVESEGIDPTAAESFVKQAKEKKKVIIYLSKKADFEPGQIPQFGQNPPQQINPLGSQQDYLPLSPLKGALNTGDGQTIESVVISELLKSPDMNEKITEYLPDIEEAIDRLGRILFLGRLHINKLGESNDADEVFTFLSLLKNVYKQLGDNFIKLERLAANAA